MNATEATQLTRLDAAICPAQAFDEYTPDVWRELLADLRFEDARLAVVHLGATLRFISPADIRAEVRRIRADRLERVPVPPPPPGVDYLRWLRDTRRRIADGTFEPPPEIEGRKPPALDHVFRRVQ